MFVFAEDVRTYAPNATVTPSIGLDVAGCRVWMELNEDKRYGWCVMAAQFGGKIAEIVYASGFNDNTTIKTTDATKPVMPSMVGQAICADVIVKMETAIKDGVLAYDHTKAAAAADAWYTAIKADPTAKPKAWWDAPAGG